MLPYVSLHSAVFQRTFDWPIVSLVQGKRQLTSGAGTLVVDYVGWQSHARGLGRTDPYVDLRSGFNFPDGLHEEGAPVEKTEHVSHFTSFREPSKKKDDFY